MKNNISVWVGLILALLGVFVPIGIAFVEAPTNELVVEWVSTDNLVSNTGQGSDLKVFFGQKLVEEPKLVKVQIKNNGTEPIKKTDFDTPLQLEVALGATLLKASISSTIPDSIPAEVSIESNALQLKPLLLNPEDTLNISIIISGEIEDLTVLGRIANIHNLELVKRETGKDNVYVRGILIVTSVFVCFLYIYLTNIVMNLRLVVLPMWLGWSCTLATAGATGYLLKEILSPYLGGEYDLAMMLAAGTTIVAIGYIILYSLEVKDNS